MSWLKDNWEKAFDYMSPEQGDKLRNKLESTDIKGYLQKKKFQIAMAQGGDAKARAIAAATPIYSITPEAEQLQGLFSDRASELRDTGADIESMANARSGMSQYGGALDQRQVLRDTTRSGVRDITNIGGSSASVLGSVAGLEAQNVSAMRDIAAQNQMFRDQAQRDYLQSLNERVGLEAQATGMEAQGLQSMISEKDKVYQSKLDRIKQVQQTEITLAGNTLAGQ